MSAPGAPGAPGASSAPITSGTLVAPVALMVPANPAAPGAPPAPGAPRQPRTPYKGRFSIVGQILVDYPWARRWTIEVQDWTNWISLGSVSGYEVLRNRIANDPWTPFSHTLNSFVPTCESVGDVAFQLFDTYGTFKRGEFQDNPFRRGTGVWGDELNKGNFFVIDKFLITKDDRSYTTRLKLIRELLSHLFVLLQVEFVFINPEYVKEHSGWIKDRHLISTVGFLNSQFRKCGFRRVGRSDFLCCASNLHAHPSQDILPEDDYDFPIPPEELHFGEYLGYGPAPWVTDVNQDRAGSYPVVDNGSEDSSNNTNGTGTSSTTLNGTPSNSQSPSLSSNSASANLPAANPSSTITSATTTTTTTAPSTTAPSATAPSATAPSTTSLTTTSLTTTSDSNLMNPSFSVQRIVGASFLMDPSTDTGLEMDLAASAISSSIDTPTEMDTTAENDGHAITSTEVDSIMTDVDALAPLSSQAHAEVPTSTDVVPASAPVSERNSGPLTAASMEGMLRPIFPFAHRAIFRLPDKRLFLSAPRVHPAVYITLGAQRVSMDKETTDKVLYRFFAARNLPDSKNNLFFARQARVVRPPNDQTWFLQFNGQTLLHFAALHRKFDTICALLEAPEAQHLLTTVNSSGFTPEQLLLSSMDLQHRARTQVNGVTTATRPDFRGYDELSAKCLMRLRGVPMPFSLRAIARGKGGCTCNKCRDGVLSRRTCYILMAICVHLWEEFDELDSVADRRQWFMGHMQDAHAVVRTNWPQYTYREEPYQDVPGIIGERCANLAVHTGFRNYFEFLHDIFDMWQIPDESQMLWYRRYCSEWPRYGEDFHRRGGRTSMVVACVVAYALKHNVARSDHPLRIGPENRKESEALHCRNDNDFLYVLRYSLEDAPLDEEAAYYPW
ncbi:MAG: hypothetical protein M1819_001926 [Sarea resinae]|nr:MAG: hypothetical protein M1819_001926 [Sarea resinae]